MRPMLKVVVGIIVGVVVVSLLCVGLAYLRESFTLLERVVEGGGSVLEYLSTLVTSTLHLLIGTVLVVLTLCSLYLLVLVLKKLG